MQEMHKIREAVLKALYQRELSDSKEGAVFSEALEPHDGALEGLKLKPEGSRIASALFRGVCDNVGKIDTVIEECSENWTVERMTIIDRNILRLAAYELLYCPDVPYKVVIDEAVELAKKFGTAESSAFINGILDKAASEASLKSSIHAL